MGIRERIATYRFAEKCAETSDRSSRCGSLSWSTYYVETLLPFDPTVHESGERRCSLA
jgi:hypothetical protein